MAKNANDIAKDLLGSVMMQVVILTAENEQLKEDLANLKSEQLKNKESKEDASKPIV